MTSACVAVPSVSMMGTLRRAPPAPLPRMHAAWYEKQGPAESVLVVGEMPDPSPGPGEVRIRVRASGINPGDVKKRSDAFGVGMPYPRVIPHSDGAGVVDAVGEGVAEDLVGERVWCFGAQSYRPFGTAAEFVVVPRRQIESLPTSVDFAQGACLGIPGITAHRAVHVAGSPSGKTVLVQGGAGAVGSAAVALARAAGARVLATVRSEAQEATAASAGAEIVVRTDGLGRPEAAERILDAAPDGVDHVVEVAFDANVHVDAEVLRPGGSIAAYATWAPEPVVPFWPMVFKNLRVCFLGSDDFSEAASSRAARDITSALASGWSGYRIAERLPLGDIAKAHARVEGGEARGRVVLELP